MPLQSDYSQFLFVLINFLSTEFCESLCNSNTSLKKIRVSISVFEFHSPHCVLSRAKGSLSLAAVLALVFVDGFVVSGCAIF